MSINVVARKLLWGRAGNQCAWHSCSQRLTVDLRSPETSLLSSNGAVLGEEAHIRSARVDGPRYNTDFPAAAVDEYLNLILLCPTHHAVIDKSNGAAWPVQEILSMKHRHEQSVDQSIGSGELRIRDVEEHMAALISVWEAKAGLDQWETLTSHLNSVHPALTESEWEELFSLSTWLLQRRWPVQYPKVATAFENHRRMLTLLAQHLSKVVDFRDGWYRIDRPHTRIDGLNPVLYTELLSTLNVDCHIIWMLTIELSRSVNLLIAAIADEFDPLYRFGEGVVLISDGDVMSGFTLIRLEYEKVDWNAIPHSHSLEAVSARMVESLEGGDPRNGKSINLYELDLAEWIKAPAPE